MFRLAYGAASKFKYITQAMAKISDEATLEVAADEVKFWLMSPDKTSLAIFRIPAVSLEELEAEEVTRLIIRTDELNKLVKRATRNDILILEYDPSTLSLTLSLRDRKHEIPRSFELTVVDTNASELKEPTFETTTRFIMDAKVFKVIVQDAKVVGDVITFESTENEEVLVTVRGEEKEYTWRLTRGKPLEDIEVDEPSKASYTRTSLEASAKPTGAAERTKIEFATDHPMKMEYSFPNAEKMIIYIAPTIE